MVFSLSKLLFSSAFLVVCVTAYSSFSPRSRCGNLKPGHGRKMSNSNYYIDLNGITEYTPGNPITVTLRGGDLQGLLLHVRKTDGSTSAVGKFQTVSTSGFKNMKCQVSNDAVSHANKQNKRDPQFTWIPPADVGPVQFRALVMPSFGYYDNSLSSDVIQPARQTTTTTTTTTTTPKPTTTTTTPKPTTTTTPKSTTTTTTTTKPTTTTSTATKPTTPTSTPKATTATTTTPKPTTTTTTTPKPTTTTTTTLKGSSEESSDKSTEEKSDDFSKNSSENSSDESSNKSSDESSEKSSEEK